MFASNYIQITWKLNFGKISIQNVIHNQHFIYFWSVYQVPANVQIIIVTKQYHYFPEGLINNFWLECNITWYLYFMKSIQMTCKVFSSTISIHLHIVAHLVYKTVSPFSLGRYKQYLWKGGILGVWIGLGWVFSGSKPKNGCTGNCDDLFIQPYQTQENSFCTGSTSIFHYGEKIQSCHKIEVRDV